MPTISYRSHGEDDTNRLGRAVAQVLPSRAAVALCGTLGAGKTHLARAVAEADGVPAGRVVSPTFTLCNEYFGRRKVNHLDFYRVADEDELFELGFDEYVQSESLTLIEWADRFPEALPDERLEIWIHLVSDQSRDFEILAQGQAHQGALRQLEELL